MIAPIDAKASFEVEGETITLRLNWRSIALAEEHGIDLLAMDETTELRPTKAATLVKCLAVQEHPEFTEDHTIAIVAKAPVELAKAIVELFASYGGKVSAPQGKAKARVTRKAG